MQIMVDDNSSNKKFQLIVNKWVCNNVPTLTNAELPNKQTFTKFILLIIAVATIPQQIRILTPKIPMQRPKNPVKIERIAGNKMPKN